MVIRIGIVGVGKIARDQHLPAIAASEAFELTATVSRGEGVEGMPNFATVAELAQAKLVDAVALCVPPQPRFDLACAALAAGFDVLLEKPPAAAMGDVERLRMIGEERGCVLFATWHARCAPGVEPARRWLDGKRIRHVRISWAEDVRRWHPGQDWIFAAGGLGVFDPGINALSIATRILPPFRLAHATLDVPANRQSPVAAQLRFAIAGGGEIDAAFDFQHPGEPEWDIEVATDGGRLVLRHTGATLEIDGEAQTLPPSAEYPTIYARFAQLIAARQTDFDAEPLMHVADAFMAGERHSVARFDW